MFISPLSRGAAVLAVAGFALAAVPFAQAEAQAKLDDPTIFAIFDAANTWDIEKGTLASKKATTKEIRDFGAMLAHDHTGVRQMGRDLAKKAGAKGSIPKDFPLAIEHEASMKKLNAVSGKEFDREFLTRDVAYHKAVIDAVGSTLLPSLQSQEFKDLLTKVAPAFQAHMMAAQRLLDNLK
jgi:putative membrane protein